MQVTAESPTLRGEGKRRGVGCAYLFQLGEGTSLWKLGKAKDHEERRKALRTTSIDRLILYAEIRTEHYSEIETLMKHLLQSHRWLGGEGSEIYEADHAVIDEVVATAKAWDAEVLPRMAEAAQWATHESNGTVLTPTQAVKELHKERLRLKQIEWWAKHEGQRIDTEFKLVMRAASGLDGISTWRSGFTTDFDEARFRRDHEALYERYTIRRPTRSFKIRW